MEHVWTYVGDTLLHRDISFCLAAGPILGLVGGSGSGKTTLLREMIGLQAPSQGRVHIFGECISEIKTTKRHDFGPRPLSTLPSTVPGSVRLAFQQVEAADWLAVTEIHYRLLYSDPTRIRAYAYHQWVAPPSKLMEQRFRQVWLSASENASPQGTPARIKIELQRFEQVFDSPTLARAVVQVRAQLFRPGRSPHAGTDRIFIIEGDCAPDVQGAIKTLAAMANQAVLAIWRWAIEAAAVVNSTEPRDSAAAVVAINPG